MFLTGPYHAINTAVGKDKIKPNAKPATTEIKLLVISLKNTPLSIIVNIDLKVTTKFGKLREVISTLVSYADVQSQCYRDLKDEMLAMRNDFKDAQKQSAETNKAVLEAIKVMTKAIKEKK